MKTFAFKVDPLTGEEYLEVYLRGRQLANDPLLNKLSCFTEEERQSLELDGSLRAHISTMSEQVSRQMEMYRRKTDDLERHTFLQSLLDRSEVLFYRILCDHLVEMVPIVYTPTVGQVCLQHSHIMRRYRGVYISPSNIANIDHIFQFISRPQVYLIVVTDGERILGLGDLGSDGMGIPVGKVNLYVAAGGLHPAVCLPVCLDVGTNNQRLLEDPLYLGYRQPRLEGAAYAEFVERFVLGVKRNFPDALLQWEDFAKHKALALLERYRERILSFNDDIQGTGATALAALMTAMRIKQSAFQDQRFVIAGMGQAGIGIARNIEAVLREEGCTEAEARSRIYPVDQPGLLLDDNPCLEEPQRLYARPRSSVDGWRVDTPGKIGLADVVVNARATVLIGVTARTGLFDERILSTLGRNTDRPVVFALSNPTSCSECTPGDLARVTDGRGLFAAGSPFLPVDWQGGALVTSQCNNLYMFPGIGLGALVARAPRITDAMFLAASKALSRMVTLEQQAQGLLLPPMEQIREVSFQVACAVERCARDSGLGRLLSDDEYAQVTRKAQWDPHYPPYRPGTPPSR